MSDIKKLTELIHPQTIDERVHTWEQMTKKHSDHHSLKQAVTIIRHFETTIESQKGQLDIYKRVCVNAEKSFHEKNLLIHSQKEEIADLKEQSESHYNHFLGANDEADALTKQIESLKAITELAVKGLKEISDGGNWNGEKHVDIAANTLYEIERLQHD